MQGISSEIDWPTLARDIRRWGGALGFDAIGIADTGLGEAPAHLARWLAAGFHGDMDYMSRHADLRTDPAALVPGTLRVITARMNYWPGTAAAAWQTLDTPRQAYLSRYALGRDYHKVLRQRLQALADRIAQQIGPFAHRVFTDSAPLMEVALAANGGIGWRGKHTLLLSKSGSWFFLGEICVALPLPVDPPQADHCGTCRRCIDVCPTRAILAPYQLDARRCISYLTIEHRGAIPEELRPLLGNRIYGCDDCQLVCPWNRFATSSQEADFAPRHRLDSVTLVELFAWSAEAFQQRLAGSAIRRIGHERWLRNLAVALGNAPRSDVAIAALKARNDHPSALVREHVSWALARQASAATAPPPPAPAR
jgi:epoxyqueuosine reductase